MASKIGKRGSGKGPGKTSMKGTYSSGNLGSKTSQKARGGPSHDATAQIARTPINPGPGGTQRR